MPTFEVGLDDGRTIHIDADDHDAALAGAQHFLANNPKRGPAQQNMPPLPSGYQLEDGSPQQTPAQNGRIMFDSLPKGPTRPDGSPLKFDDLPPLPNGFQLEQAPAQGAAPSVGKDIATQVAAHAADLPENLISSGPNLMKALGHGVTYLADKFAPASGVIRDRVEEMKQKQAKQDELGAALAPLQSHASDLFPKAQTAAGEVAGNMTDFGSMALLPGSALQRVMNVIKPAVGSEVGGQAAKAINPDYEQAGRLAGAVLLGGGKKTVPEPTKFGAYFAEADKNFDALRGAKVDLHQDSVRGFAQKTQDFMRNDKDLEGTSAYNLLDKYANADSSVPLSKLEVLRSNLVDAAQSPVGRERKAGRIALDNLDQYRDGLTAAHTTANGQNLADALANWKAGDKNQLVGCTVESVAGKLYRDDLNKDHTLREQLKPLLLQSKFAKRFTGDDKESIESIIHGSTALNLAQKALSGINGHNSFLLPLIGGEAIGQATGSPFEAGVPAAIALHIGMRGVGARLAAMQAAKQRQNVNALLNTIGARSVGVKQPKAAVSPVLSRALARTLAGSLANRTAQP
jgi:hypothetical protein